MSSTTIQNDRRELLQLLKKEAYIKEKIVLSSGKESDFYIDARRVTLSAKGAFLCARLILDLIKGDKVDAVGGPTLGADPLVGAVGVLSYEAGRPLNTFLIRKAPKPHGRQQQVEGPLLKAGSRVVLIDDVTTTGKSLLKSIDVLHQLSLVVPKAVCLVDRREGAREALEAKGCQLTAVFEISEIIDVP